jgi:hypothetical protein
MNILLKSFFNIKDKSAYGRVPPEMLHADDAYSKMQNISIESFQQNLAGDWRLIYLSGKMPTLQQSFIYTAKETKRLWQEYYPCNILYTDPDTLCIKPLDIFDQFNEFRLFTADKKFDRWSLTYWNCGVRYFPQTITKEFWQKLDDYIVDWDHNVYDYEQMIYRRLMLEQPEFLTNIDQPQSHIVAQTGLTDIASMLETPIGSMLDSTCAILHLHGSRNPKARAELMEKLWTVSKR